MRLDLLIPTLRRPELLRATIGSIAASERPRNLKVSVTVVNNDRDPELPGLWPALAAVPYPVCILHEPRLGKSAALNTGIAASTAEYVGLIDDDEQLSPDWFLVAEGALERGRFDFFGGRSVLLEVSRKPVWIPSGYPAVLGVADGGSHEATYGSGFPGMLMGGNAVISRSVLARVGPYSTDLGPRADCRLFSCEDEDMYWRLIDAGAHGRYLPQLVVYHHLHPERLRKSYYRAWCFWNGASKGVLSRRRPVPVAKVAGVPRYLYAEAARGFAAWLRGTLSGGPPDLRMEGELPVWHLAGRLYGRHVHDTDGIRGSMRTSSAKPAGEAVATEG